MAVQDRSQKMEQLRLAEAVRLERAALRRRMRSAESREESRRIAIAILLEVPRAAERWQIDQFLVCIQRFGSASMRKLLADMRIGEIRFIGALTERQRLLIAARLMP